MFIEQEVNRINAYTVQGEQSIMVQHDVKAWAVENGYQQYKCYLAARRKSN